MKRSSSESFEQEVELTLLVEESIRCGLVLPHRREWVREMGRKSLEALKETLRETSRVMGKELSVMLRNEASEEQTVTLAERRNEQAARPLVEESIRCGLVLPHRREWLLSVGRRDVTALREVLLEKARIQEGHGRPADLGLQRPLGTVATGGNIATGEEQQTLGVGRRVTALQEFERRKNGEFASKGEGEESEAPSMNGTLIAQADLPKGDSDDSADKESRQASVLPPINARTVNDTHPNTLEESEVDALRAQEIRRRQSAVRAHGKDAEEKESAQREALQRDFDADRPYQHQMTSNPAAFHLMQRVTRAGGLVRAEVVLQLMKVPNFDRLPPDVQDAMILKFGDMTDPNSHKLFHQLQDLMSGPKFAAIDRKMYNEVAAKKKVPVNQLNAWMQRRRDLEKILAVGKLLKDMPYDLKTPEGARKAAIISQKPKGVSYSLAIHQLFTRYYAQIHNLAKELGIDETFLLALAAREGGWLDLHNYVLNNPFGQTLNGGGDNRGYPDVAAAMKQWKERWGPVVKGSKTVEEFASRLKEAHYNTVNPNWKKDVVDIHRDITGKRNLWLKTQEQPVPG